MPKPVITLSKSSSTVIVGATDTITVTNGATLTNLKVVSATPATATATLSGNTITIKGVKSGTTTATVSADGADDKTINITVNKIPLGNVLTVKALGELADNTAPTIKAAAISANTATGLTDAMFDITGTPTTTGATATGKGEYTGTVQVTFTVAAG